MLRVLYFLIVVFAIGIGFAWLADHPGQLVVTVGGYRYEVSVMVGAVLALLLVAAVMLLWWAIRSIWNSPYFIARYFRVRRRDRGYQALSTGLIAAGAGDAALARRMNRQAGKLIDSDREPLIHLLDAQASLLEGDHAAARQRFEAMIDDPEMKVLGLHGLYVEAERLGERAAARHYAARAADIAPQLAWAADATIEARSEQGDWDGALKLLEAQKSTRQVDRDLLARRRAVILTAKAISALDHDPAETKTAAVEANKLAPALVPAAVTAAKAYFRMNDLRRGSRILEAAWKLEPHPEIAEAYVHARPGDSSHDRLERARKLQSIRTNNVESSLAVARAALEAGEFALARSETEAALRMGPREAGYLLMADIEEADGAAEGRIRQWLARAVRAPRDPAWVADGHVSDRWAPFSPVSGRLDAFEWRSPAERLGALIDYEEPAMDRPEAVLIAPAVEEAGPAMPEEDDRPEKEEKPEPALRPAQVPQRAAEGNSPPSPRPGPMRPPDDPGVEPEGDVEAETLSRFRLF
jgi:HemY protein